VVIRMRVGVDNNRPLAAVHLRLSGRRAVAREQVWQVWQLPYQCHDWYGAAVPLNCSKLPILPIRQVRCSGILTTPGIF